MELTQTQVNVIVTEAKQAAQQAARKFFNEKLGGQDQYACGFAWVEIYGVKGNTKLGKMLKAAGVSQNYNISDLESQRNGRTECGHARRRCSRGRRSVDQIRFPCIFRFTFGLNG